MTRTIIFKKVDENTYKCFENDKVVFAVNSENMQFNVKDFYDGIYKDNKEYDINIDKEIDENDKVGKRIYDCIFTLIEKITKNLTKINEQEDKNESETLEENNGDIDWSKTF